RLGGSGVLLLLAGRGTLRSFCLRRSRRQRRESHESGRERAGQNHTRLSNSHGGKPLSGFDAATKRWDVQLYATHATVWMPWWSGMLAAIDPVFAEGPSRRRAGRRYFHDVSVAFFQDGLCGSYLVEWVFLCWPIVCGHKRLGAAACVYWDFGSGLS